uniref:Uncharacterized protein n=1 Tax=Arundo donax TaxID=35708 RepID=A0A0A9BQQ7_ARUDO
MVNYFILLPSQNV